MNLLSNGAELSKLLCASTIKHDWVTLIVASTICLVLLSGCASAPSLFDLKNQDFVNMVTVELPKAPLDLDSPAPIDRPYGPFDAELRIQAIIEYGDPGDYVAEMQYILFTPGCGISARLSCAYFLIDSDEYALNFLSYATHSAYDQEAVWVALKIAKEYKAGTDISDSIQAILKEYCDETLVLELSRPMTSESNTVSNRVVKNLGRDVVYFLNETDSSFVSALKDDVESLGAKWPYDVPSVSK